MERKSYIDIMKGVGIISVVIGHLYSGKVHQFIFLFHMPLFFFIGGFLFKRKEQLKSYFNDKVIHLLVPYITFLLLIYPFVNPPNTSTLNFTELFIYLIKPIIGGRSLTSIVGVFWFITCFFIVQQFFNLILIKIKNNNHLLYVSIAILLLGYINSLWFPNFWLPLNINVVFAALPLFMVGYLVREMNIEIPFIPLFILFLIVLVSLFYLENNTYDMKYSEYGIPFVTFFSSIIFILFIKKLAIWLDKIPLLSTSLIMFGKASMIIMYLHLPVKYFIEAFFDFQLTLVFILSTVIPFTLYLLFVKYSVTKALFLGSKSDLLLILKKLKN